VRANTGYQGLLWDIEMDTSWTYGQVWEAVQVVWTRKLKEKSTTVHQDASGPLTKMQVRDEHGRLAAFTVREGWTYELVEEDWRGPELANRPVYKPHPRPAKPEVEVLVGLQLEDGLRVSEAGWRGDVY
jgi:hypothetical protein